MIIDRLHRLRRLLSTVRHLRPSQMAYRVGRRLHRSAVELGPPPPLRSPQTAAVEPADRLPCLIAADSFAMLGQSGKIDSAASWNDTSRDKLWLYHCHYFEDLLARGRDDRRTWHEALIQRWVTDNPPGVGNGWEPYPLSLRISHWVLWARLGGSLVQDWRHSLAIQVRWLRRNIEWDILANHVIANAKALTLAGCWAGGNEGDRWLNEGLDLLRGQLNEQILPDGGHIERSPMYHCQVLNDLLDVVNGLRSAGLDTPPWLRMSIGHMGHWLAVMRHPDGNIPLFNDSAFQMAPHPDALATYAERLGLGWSMQQGVGSVWLEQTGYARLTTQDLVIFCDAAPLGPDWQPGHGHADTLTWEASLHGNRIIVDPGTSTYGTSLERLRQRSTGAHNTITIDGQDSSEVWGGFRVGRRAKIITASIDNDGMTFRAEHNGYIHQGITHRRNWRIGNRGLTVDDFIEGEAGIHQLESGVLLHPDCFISGYKNNQAIVVNRNDRHIHYALTYNADCAFIDATYHPAFGVSIPTSRLTKRLYAGLPYKSSMNLDWHTCASAY